jgi:hypothetical protein
VEEVSRRGQIQIFFTEFGELSEEGVAHRRVRTFCLDRGRVVRRGKCQGQGARGAGCGRGRLACQSTKFGGSGEWGAELWADLELACRKQKQLLSTAAGSSVFILWTEGSIADGRLAKVFFISSGLRVFILPESNRHGLEALRSSRPALGIKSSRHERDVDQMELSSLTEGLHTRLSPGQGE